MKNRAFFTSVFLMMCIVIFTTNCTYASMADYTDEDAEKDTQKMIQEHNEQFDSTKSDNCFLKELSIKEGDLSPNFDRQIIEYSVKVANNLNEINITANPEDNRAKVNGTGKIDIRNNTECKIEVIAESGTTRTYFIKINKSNDDNIEDVSKEDNTSKNELVENDIDAVEINNNNTLIYEDDNSNNMENNKIKKYIPIGIIIAIILLLLFLCIIVTKSNNKKGKH